MGNKKQSSIEQVFSHIKASRNDIQYWNDSMLVDWLLEQEYRLKEMHKEEIEDAYMNSTAQFANDARIDYPKSADDYYNEQFEGNNG